LAIIKRDSKVWNNRDAICHTVTNGKSVYAHGAGLVFENLGIKKTRVFSETGKRITAAKRIKNHASHHDKWHVQIQICTNKEVAIHLSWLTDFLGISEGQSSTAFRGFWLLFLDCDRGGAGDLNFDLRLPGLGFLSFGNLLPMTIGWAFCEGLDATLPCKIRGSLPDVTAGACQGWWADASCFEGAVASAGECKGCITDAWAANTAAEGTDFGCLSFGGFQNSSCWSRTASRESLDIKELGLEDRRFTVSVLAGNTVGETKVSDWTLPSQATAGKKDAEVMPPTLGGCSIYDPVAAFNIGLEQAVRQNYVEENLWGGQWQR
jgi:hypothetical protein